MHQRLSVIVQVDLEQTYCRLQVTGCLTEINQRGLHSLIRRARALPTGAQVIVDLSLAPLSSPLALDLLRRAVDDESDGRMSPVRFVTAERTASISR